MNMMSDPTNSQLAGALDGNGAARKSIDWERVEIDFRAGFKTLREIAGQHGITHAAIQKRAKRDGWDRDLQGRIHAKAAALVAKQSVAKPGSQVSKATEREVVSAEAAIIAQVQTGRRAMVERLRSAATKLVAEMEGMDANASTALLGQLRDLAEKIEDPNARRGTLNQISDVENAVTLEARITMFNKLMSSAGALLLAEADVYGLSKDAPAGSVPAGLSLFYPEPDAPASA
jgi:hypothetical protein